MPGDGSADGGESFGAGGPEHPAQVGDVHRPAGYELGDHQVLQGEGRPAVHDVALRGRDGLLSPATGQAKQVELPPAPAPRPPPPTATPPPPSLPRPPAPPRRPPPSRSVP